MLHQPLIFMRLGEEGALDLTERSTSGDGHSLSPTRTGVRVTTVSPNTAVVGADAEDIGERYLHALFAWEVHACDACHDQPCRCLCLGLRLQMMRTTPCRLMTLQCSQIGFTLERTFTRLSRPG